MQGKSSHSPKLIVMNFLLTVELKNIPTTLDHSKLKHHNTQMKKSSKNGSLFVLRLKIKPNNHTNHCNHIGFRDQYLFQN
jgi:hypothetical protein